MSKYNLGKVAPVYMGSYETDTTYNELDIVEFNGSSYIARQSVTGVTPGTDDTIWGLIADKGPKGDKGDRGPQGIQGIQGAQGKTGVAGKDAVINVVTQAEYDALPDKTGVYFIGG